MKCKLLCIAFFGLCSFAYGQMPMRMDSVVRVTTVENAEEFVDSGAVMPQTRVVTGNTIATMTSDPFEESVIIRVPAAQGNERKPTVAKENAGIAPPSRAERQ